MQDDQELVTFPEILEELPGIDLECDLRDDHPVETEVKTGQERQHKDAMYAVHNDSLMETPADPGPDVESNRSRPASTDVSGQE